MILSFNFLLATNGDRVGAMKVYKKALKAEKKLS